MAQAWQGEHPSIGFTTITIGDTLTEKSEVTPPEVVSKWVPRWQAVGLGSGRLMDPGSVAEDALFALGRAPRTVPGHGNRLASLLMGLMPSRRAIRTMGEAGRAVLAARENQGE